MVCASTFGRISPKSSSRKVTSTVLKRNSDRRNVKIESMIPEARITMQMFTRLLTTRIVASSMSTFFSRKSTASAEADFCSRMRRTSERDNEKKAVSAPETRAETKSRQHAAAHITAMRGDMPLQMIHADPGSKSQTN